MGVAMKYARLVDHSRDNDGSDIRALDVVDTAIYSPRPAWGQTDEALLNRSFESVGGFAAFSIVPNHVEPSACKVGDDYENPAMRVAKFIAAELAAAKEAAEEEISP